MKRSESIEVRVTKKRKERWQKEVEKSNEVGNLSDLIRLSVVQKVNGILDENAIDEIPLDFDDGKMLEEMSELKKTNIKLVEEISDIKSRMGNSDEIAELSRDLEEIMIQVPSEDEFRKVEIHGMSLVDDEISIIGTAEAFAEYLNRDVGKIHQALSRSKRQNPNVEFIYSDSGARRYYKLNPKVDGYSIPDEIETNEFQTATEIDE